MNWGPVYSWSKTIHKMVMWGVVILGSWMMVSGYLMHKELEGESLVPKHWMLIFREWHNNVSTYFLVFLLLQIATGLLIWGVPKIIQRLSRKN